MHAASVGAVIPGVPGALMGKNGDSQTGWESQNSFQVDKFQQLSTNQGLICIVSDVGVPKVVSTFRIIKGPHLRVRTSAFPIGGIQDLR